MDAFGLPKSSDTEKAVRKAAIQSATKNAIEVPLKVMQLSLQSFEVIKAMAEIGNPNSVSDAGVGALCARSAVYGAWLNVKINASGYEDKAYVQQVLAQGETMLNEAIVKEKDVLKLVETKIG
jgi:glutamate formiminotransferase/formiminotetrahydrofolate cyclodeaminase